MKRNTLIICGGGIIGVTIAREAALSKKFSEIRVLEKDNKLGSHSSTRNSGVIHAGFYYSPESKKAKYCSFGNKLMREYCLKNKINIKPCGKVVVTKNEEQEKTLYELYDRGKKNGCDLEIFTKDKLLEYEPLGQTYKNFLWSPNTWSVSPTDLFNSLINECKSLNIKFSIGEGVISAGSNFVNTSKRNKLHFDYLINACGGFALDIAKLFGINTNYKLLPFKGLYLKSSKKLNQFKRHIYPVPNIDQPFLGIHTTITSDDHLKLGPTAIPVFSPENYSLFEGLNFNSSLNTLLLQINLLSRNEFGFRDLAFREIRYLIKDNILKKANELTTENLKDIEFKWYSPGIRAQLYDQSKKTLENDFILINKKNTLHILNSISPAWSCSFVNAKEIIKTLNRNIEN